MIEPLIYSRLVANVGGLLGDVGGGFDNAFDDSFDNGDPITARVYPVVPTQDTEVPFVLYTVSGADPVWTLNGPTGFYSYSFSVECFAVTFAHVLTIADAVRHSLDGWTDSTVRYCKLDSQSTQEVSGTGGEPAYQYSLSFTALAGA